MICNPLTIPIEVNYILNCLYDNNYEAYIVGGCVRDCIMGRVPNDWDIATSARPDEVKGLFEHTADTGIKHGTITVIINKKNFEVTTFRIDGEYKDGRRPENVYYTANLTEDLRRRDFTINAIAYSLIEQGKGEDKIFDPFHGVDDINAKVIRGVGNPDKRFQEDALRMLRALRFSAQLGFQIEVETKNAIFRNAELVEKISKERVKDELVKLINSDTDSIQQLMLMYNSRLSNFIDDVFDKYLSEYKHDFHFLDCSKKNRIALLFKDMEAEQLEDLMKRLKFDNKTISHAKTLVSYIPVDIIADEYEIRKILSALGRETFMDLCELKKLTGYNNMDNIMRLCDEICQRGDCIRLSELAVSGEDLLRLGYSGERIGIILNKLLDAVLRDTELNTKDELTRLIGLE